MKILDITKGMICKVELRKKSVDSVCYFLEGGVIQIKLNSPSYRALSFVAFENEYDSSLCNKRNNELDIMKIWSNRGEILYDRKREENKTKWNEVSLGTEVEYNNNGEWKKAQFVFYYPESDVILMRDNNQLICNHTSKTVRMPMDNIETTEPNNQNKEDVNVDVNQTNEDELNEVLKDMFDTLFGR